MCASTVVAPQMKVFALYALEEMHFYELPAPKDTDAHRKRKPK